MTSVTLRRELASTPYTIPDGSSPVGTHRIDGSSPALLLSFPPGWQREATGHYSDAEEFILLAGALAMNEEVHRAGTWVMVPGRSLREGTRTPEGALAIAWFDGRASWTTEERPTSARSAHVDLARASRASSHTPFGPGRTLRRRRSWWVTQLSGGPTDVARQVLSTDPDGVPRLHLVEPGEPLPPIAGACFVRTTIEIR